MKRIIYWLLACLCFYGTSYAQSTAQFFEKSNAFFKEHIKAGGLVDYKSIKSSTKELDELTNMIENQITLGRMSSNEQKAFYINAYNILTINKVIKKYPIKSPMDIPGFFDKKDVIIGGKKLSLNHIENEILRKKFPDARLHFALVCAAKGCPKIQSEAILPKTIESQLNSLTKNAINDRGFIKIDEKKKKVYYSQIFDWYKADFTRESKSINKYIQNYISNSIEGYKFFSYEYDWSLNDI